MTRADITKNLEKHPFIPHPALKNPHAQTIAGTMIRRRFKDLDARTESRFFDTHPGVRVLAHCSWQEERTSRPTGVIAHGMEGSTESRYMLGTPEKGLGAGCRALR